MMWTARVRTQALTLTDPIDFASLTFVERYGPPDTLVLEGDVAALGPAKTPGSGIVVCDDDGKQRFSGWLNTLTRTHETATAAYVSDTQLLWDRLAWISPLTRWDDPGQQRDTLTGNVETRILNLINRNAGSITWHTGEYANRYIPALRLPTSLNRGASGTTVIRLGEYNLGDRVARLAESANLRVVVKQTYVGTTPYLDVVVTSAPDLSAWARFGDSAGGDLGMLGEDWSYTIGAPPATIVLPIAGMEDVVGDTYLGGIGHVPSRETVWGRYIERFVDFTGDNDPSEIAERIAEVIAETVPTVEVSAPIVAGDLEFGDDTGQIPVGAKVAVSLDGETVVERIRQVTTTVQATEGSPTVTVEPLVGSPDSGLTVEQKTLRAALRRLRRLESQ